MDSGFGHEMIQGMYLTPEIRLEVCYHCVENHPAVLPDGYPVTEQWVKYFGDDNLRAWECQVCKQLIPDADFPLEDTAQTTP